MAFRLTHVIRPDGSDDQSWCSYICGHCGAHTTGAVLATWPVTTTKRNKLVICTVCDMPSAITQDDRIFPGTVFGPQIEGLPSDVQAAYEEARQCFSVNAYTACELICRKILMHIAVDKTASEGKDFEFYIDFLEQAGYITTTMKSWVTLIRQHGNKATHRLAAPDKKRAESTLMFTAELLRIVYEMAYIASNYVPTTSP